MIHITTTSIKNSSFQHTDRITKTLLVFCILLFCNCDGSLGGFDNRIFPTSKKQLEVALHKIYLDHPEYKIPQKWKEFDNWSQRGFDFLESRIFYIKDHPEEMYYISFVGDSTMLADPKQVIIAIRAVHQDSVDSWKLEEDFENNERERIERRFDREIISKLEGYTQTKAKRKDGYKY
jgi:hypothetical protein